MIEQLNRLSELDNGELVLTLDDTELTIRRLPISQFARATNLLRANRQKEYSEATRLVPIPAEVRGKAMAEIACAPTTLLDLVDDWTLRIEMIVWGMDKAGYKGTKPQAQTVLDELSMEDIGKLLDAVTGLGLYAKEDDKENPTISTSTDLSVDQSGTS